MHDAALRAAVERTDRALAQMPRGTSSDDTAAVTEARAAWAALVQALALGPAPAQRECPACRRTVMRAATVCGFCWTKLAPPEPQAR